MRLPKKLLLGLPALAALAYGLWWWQAANTLDRQIQAWIEGERSRGASVEVGALTVSGFPLWVRAEATAITYRRADGLTWQGSSLMGQARPWRITDIALELPGPHALRLPAQNSMPVEAHFRDGRGQVAMTLGGTPTDARLTLDEVALNGPPGTGTVTMDALDVTASQPPTPPADHTAAGFTVALEARGARLPVPAEFGLGTAVERLTLAGRVMGAPPKALDSAALAAWTAAGGVLNLDNLDVVWGPLALATSGTLAMDEELQPEGAFTAEVRGPFALIDALVNAGQIKAKDAGMAKTAVSLFSGTKPGATPEKAAFPLTIQNHAVWVGPLKLAPMPRLSW
ncbi:MAG TPA: DUF2125 domain-containing protein [Azospirillaceae bacterium]|nr:DUF2125 domain-containing protein [Azospirillaceae bacterium]